MKGNLSVNKKTMKLKMICTLLLGALTLSGVACNTNDSGNTDTTNAVEQSIQTTEGATAEQATEKETEQKNDTEVVMLPEQEVKVISQNLLCDENTVSNRATAMINSITALEPDSFGVQECVKAWANRIDSSLKDSYARVGVDCYGEDVGNFGTYVYYRKDKYKVIETDTFWLSTTPDVPSQYNNTANVMNRTCTWVILENIETGFRYVHVNCHLDWADQNANVVQMQMIRSLILRFENMGYPVFATGDYNTKEGSVSYGQMLASELIADSRYVADKSSAIVSHYDNQASVDFCFVTQNKMQVLEFDIIHNVREGVEVSDHNGVYTHAKVASLPKQDHSNTFAEFSANTTITCEKDAVSASRMVIRFSQAKSLDGSVADRYKVRFMTKDGEEIYSYVAHGNSYNPLQPLTATCRLSGGTIGESYMVEIIPISIFGETGAAISQEIVWVGIEQEEIETALEPDILNIVVEDNKVIDKTANKYSITQNGSVKISDGKMIFDRAGNVRTSSLNAQYPKMTNGFTLSAHIITSENLSGIAHYASNLHAGGFALYTQNGKMNFVVHNGSTYVSASATVTSNTEYYVTGVFDGSKLYLYLDGALEATVGLGGAMKIPTVESAQFLCMGADANADGTGESNSQCTVYSVQIYSNILSDKEIASLYQSK